MPHQDRLPCVVMCLLSHRRRGYGWGWVRLLGLMAMVSAWLGGVGVLRGQSPPPLRPREFAVTAEDRAWWAFQPVVRPGIPAEADAGPDGKRGRHPHPVDAFLQARLRGKGLGMNPAATPREQVRRASFDLLGLPAPVLPERGRGAATTGRRRVLAEWLAAPTNPLTARVWVNRMWQRHFGSGLVPTPDDFGRTGVGPTHPELLDYLASEFMAGGWRV